MIYWDANSTSKLRPQAQDAIKEFISENKHLNPSSIHQEGRIARAKLRDAREQFLSYLFPNTQSKNRNAKLVYTSGGTESCNSIINGFIDYKYLSSYHIVTSQIEHAAILEPLKRLEDLGAKVDFVNAKRNGKVSVEEFVSKINSQTALASLMLSNNETGIGQSVIEIAKEIKKINQSCAIVSDITQCISKSNLDLQELFDSGVDAVALSAHKIGAMPGIGAIIFNTASTCRLFYPQILGGGQEDKLRGGTEFLLGAIALGKVAEHLNTYGNEELIQRKLNKEFLFNMIKEELPEFSIVGCEFDNKYDLCNTLYVEVLNKKCRADDLVVALDIEGLLVSVGSACSSGRQDVSHVPLGMGYSKEEARKFFRISLDWDIDRSSIEEGIRILKLVMGRF